ncbi:MAG: hypothetical protein JNN30_00065 [Rhodanobacteraceae bacterium]|nr:hypothetical protein [Rhodanobacteraceae bacterium]
MSALFVVKVLAATLAIAAVVTLLFSQRPSRPVAKRGDSADTTSPVAAPRPQTAAPSRLTAAAHIPQHHAAVQAMSSTRQSDEAPSGDPNDIANYVSARISPTEPVPTAAEIIRALHEMGDHSGIGAFNPPGTSPPLRGLAVPDDFDLPQGYVRHHQVTDEGEPLEPILMFSPDGVFVDASGREMTIPLDRVVPPEMAPPGLPIREIRIPPSP